MKAYGATNTRGQLKLSSAYENGNDLGTPFVSFDEEHSHTILKACEGETDDNPEKVT